MIDIKKAVRNLEERIKVQNKIIQTFEILSRENDVPDDQ